MSGCSGGCCSSAPVCPCGPDQNPEISTLPLVIACFQHRQAGLHAEQAYYASLPSLDVAVIDAVLVLKEESGLRPDHNAGLTPEMIETLEQRLVATLDRIDGCHSFRALYELLAEHFSAVTESTTAAYDTALRIALFTGTMPDAVRVHDGNRAPLAALGAGLAEQDWVELAQLPDMFSGLSAAEAELCLSTCKEKISGLA